MTQLQHVMPAQTKGPARRSELEVRMDILKVVAQGASKPTQVMYKANLSWIALLGHLKALTGSGFLREVEFDRRREYEATPKGIEILRNYNAIVSAIHEAPMDQQPSF